MFSVEDGNKASELFCPLLSRDALVGVTTTEDAWRPF